MGVIGRYAKIPPPLKIRLSAGCRRPEATPKRIHAARRRLGPEIIAQLAADYESGRSTTWLMQTYGLGKGTVLGLLEEYGVQLRNQGVPPDQLDEIIRLYRSGLSLAKVAASFGCSAETARRALMAAGVRLRAPWERGPV